MSTGAIIGIIVAVPVVCCCITHHRVIRALIKHEPNRTEAFQGRRSRSLLPAGQKESGLLSRQRDTGSALNGILIC